MLFLNFVLLFGYWVWTLNQIPLIPEPFNVEEFIAELKVPDEDNAFNDYVQASRLLKVPDWNQLGDVSLLVGRPWKDFPEKVRQFVQSNGPALNVWLWGTSKQRACFFDPEFPVASFDLDHLQEIRSLARAISWKAVQLQDEGKLDESWLYLIGGLKTSSHLAQGGRLSARLLSSAYYSIFVPMIQRWSEDPNLTTDQLQKALQEIGAINASIPPISHTIKAEYLTYRDLNAYWRNLVAPKTRSMAQTFFMDRLSDSANRLQRHVVRNILNRCDLPDSQRTWQGNTGLFLDPKPTGPELPSDRIAALGEKNIMYSLIAPTYHLIVETSDRERMRKSGLRIVIALQIYFREQRTFPDELTSLVPDYLPELPPNPYAADVRTWSYRKEADHVVFWNQGEYFPPPVDSNPYFYQRDRKMEFFWTIYPPGTRTPLYHPLPQDPVPKDPPLPTAGK